MINYQIFEAGFCKHCDRMTRKTGRLHQAEYPALCALIKHPSEGYMVFDTGYSQQFYQLTQRLPAALYRWLTPVTLAKTLKEQLLEHNIAPEDIRYVIISHLHADHIGGLRDFPNARFIVHPDALSEATHTSGFKALLRGFLPGLLPDDFQERVLSLNHPVSLPAALAPFEHGFDIFGDKSLLAIPLPGHAKGQIGLYFEAEKATFLIADSCWHQETFQQLVYPSELTYLVHDDKVAYLDTIQRLHALYQRRPDLDMIPAHCQSGRERVRAQSC